MDTARWVVLSQLTIGGSVELILLLSSPPSLCYSTLLIFMEQKMGSKTLLNLPPQCAIRIARRKGSTYPIAACEEN
ncbi:hypothetical protein TcWFU_004499 [Taenia crassiceps]|uniref:Uncharacterized protein n=1 Tax=Taenia crassiceps TaxID=6207 RepID=A0ABR4QQA5_9CEST